MSVEQNYRPDGASIALSLHLKLIAHAIKKMLVDASGREDNVFILITARTGDPNVHKQPAQYVSSNISREDAAKMMTEVIERWKSYGDRGPVHRPHNG